MKKRTLLILGSSLVIIIIMFALWFSGDPSRYEPQMLQVIPEDEKGRQENNETSQQTEVPAEFHDNLDQAFEDLKAVDLSNQQ